MKSETRNPKLENRSQGWSAAAERELRRRIWRWWGAVWICILVDICLVAVGIWIGPRHPGRGVALFALAAVLAVAGGWSLSTLVELRGKLGREMQSLPGGGFDAGSGILANKPRSTDRLTHWTQLDSVFGMTGGFVCACGRKFAFPDMVRVNPDPDSDPLGLHSENRWVYHCPCGDGHFYILNPTIQV